MAARKTVGIGLDGDEFERLEAVRARMNLRTVTPTTLAKECFLIGLEELERRHAGDKPPRDKERGANDGSEGKGRRRG